MGALCTFLSVVGVVALAAAIYKLVEFVRINYVATGGNLLKKYAAAGNWAVVTGATEGIGYAMSTELAKRGFNVLLIARTAEKLQEVAKEIEGRNVKALSIPFDFANADEAAYAKLFAQLDGFSIGVLVNNVGVNYEYTNNFDEVDLQTDLRLLKVNCEAAVRMTKYVLPKMKEKRAGGIINLASVSAVLPTPMLATYAGTKSFMLSFSNGLHYELKRYGVDVLAVTPNLVVSKMTQGTASRKPRESFMMVNAAKMAHQTINKLGVVPHTAGHSNHAVLEAIMTSLPDNYMAGQILKLSMSVKKRVDSKRAAAAAEASKSA